MSRNLELHGAVRKFPIMARISLKGSWAPSDARPEAFTPELEDFKPPPFQEAPRFAPVVPKRFGTLKTVGFGDSPKGPYWRLS